MAVTQQDLESFELYATERLRDGGAESLHELVAEWEANREYLATVAEVNESLADYEAGKGKPASEAFDDIRKKLGLDE